MKRSDHSSLATSRSGHRGRGRRGVARGSDRGFTLVELLVALLAGLFVSMAAFLLARNASRFFQYEARIAAAQYASMVGMNRLQADLQRASFMTLPNTNVSDYKLSGTKASWPAGMTKLAGIALENGGSVVRHPGDHALTTANGLNPDAVIIGGSFHSTELFAARAVVSGGAGSQVYLQVDDGPMARTLQSAACGGRGLAEIFAPGRYLRIVDPMGWSSYGIINNFAWANPTTPVVTLESTPALPSRTTEVHSGYAGFAIGYSVNVVSRVLYDLRSIDDSLKYPQYAALFTTGTHGVSAYHRGDTAAPERVELVRVELDQNDVEIDSTLELVAEYAVDLKFGLTAEVLPQTSPRTFQRYPIGDANVYTIAQAIDTGGTPEAIRNLQVRLATRSAERDRDVTIAPPAAGGLYRFGLGTNQGFARVRTLVAEVALANNQ